MKSRKAWLRIAAAFCSFGLIALYVTFQPVIASWPGANRNELMSGSKLRPLAGAARAYADSASPVPSPDNAASAEPPPLLPGSKSASVLLTMPLRPAGLAPGPATAPTTAATPMTSPSSTAATRPTEPPATRGGR